MKTIEIPKYLLNLPFPWNIPEDSCRRKYVNVLDKDKKTIERALVALDRLLLFLSQHQEPEGKSIPEEMTEYWYFTVSSIASEIPTLEDFYLSKIEKKFHLSKIESPSEKMIEEAAQKWIWTVVRDLTNDTIIWLEEVLDNNKDPKLVSDFLAIVSRYWRLPIPLGFADDLVSTSAMIAGEKVIPLLEEVQQNAHNSSLADTAARYKRLILNRNR